MKTAMVTGPGTTEVVEVPTPSAGPTDVLVRMRACGICGSDSFYIQIGGIPPRQGATPLGHEPAGEVVQVGDRVEGIRPGDHVVNRTGVKPGDSVVVFGAGPIGLGATIGYKLSGARSVVVADVVPSRLEKALAVGADAVINSAEEDVVAR